MAPSNQQRVNSVPAARTISNVPNKKIVTSNLPLSSALECGSPRFAQRRANKDDDEVSSIDLPSPYGSDGVVTGFEFSDDPHEVARGRYKTLTNPQLFIRALQKPKARSLSALHQIVANACETLATWRNEFKDVVRRLELAETSVSATQPYIPKRDSRASGILENHELNGEGKTSTPRRRASPKKRILQPGKEPKPRRTRQVRSHQPAKVDGADVGESNQPSFTAPKARRGRKRKIEEVAPGPDDLPVQRRTRQQTQFFISTEPTDAPSVDPAKVSPSTAPIIPVVIEPEAPPKPAPKPWIRKRKSSDTDATIELAVDEPPQRKRVKIEDLLIASSAPAPEPQEIGSRTVDPPIEGNSKENLSYSDANKEHPPLGETPKKVKRGVPKKETPQKGPPKKKGRPFKNKAPISSPALAPILPAPAQPPSSTSTTTPTSSVRATRAMTNQAKTTTAPAPLQSPATTRSPQEPEKTSGQVIYTGAPSSQTPRLTAPAPLSVPGRTPLSMPTLPTAIDLSSLPAGASSTPLDLITLPSVPAQLSSSPSSSSPSLLITLRPGPSAAFSRLAASYPNSPRSVPTSTSSSLPAITLGTSLVTNDNRMVVKDEKITKGGGGGGKNHLDIDPVTGKNRTRSEAMMEVWAKRKARGTNGRHGGRPVKGQVK